MGVVPSTKATLYVRGILTDPVDSYGAAGERSTITCQIGGDKPYKVAWTKVMSTGNKELTDNELIVQSVQGSVKELN